MSSCKKSFVALAIVSALGAAPAFAAPAIYNYTTGTQASSANPELVALLGGTGVTGSFRYNPESPLYGQSGALGFEPGYAVYVGSNVTNLAFYSLAGSVGGHQFSDMLGSANVGNNHPGYLGGDVLSLIADPITPGATNTFPLTGFSVGAYTLKNVRLYWYTGLGGAGNFLNDSSMPAQPPTFTGRLALEFARTDGSTTGNPAANVVLFDGLTVRAKSSVVPEPGAYALAVAGLGIVGLAAARRRARATSPA